MPVELVSGGGSVLDLGRYSEPERCQLPHLSQEGDQLVAVVHPQLAITVAQLHETTTGLEPGEWKQIHNYKTDGRPTITCRPTYFSHQSRDNEGAQRNIYMHLLVF